MLKIIVLYKPDQEPRGLQVHRDEDKSTEPIKIKEMISSGEQADIGITVSDVEENEQWARELGEGKHIHYWEDLLAMVSEGAKMDALQKEVHHREKQVKVDDCYTLIYTSGTTGRCVSGGFNWVLVAVPPQNPPSLPPSFPPSFIQPSPCSVPCSRFLHDGVFAVCSFLMPCPMPV